MMNWLIKNARKIRKQEKHEPIDVRIKDGVHSGNR